MRRAGDEEVDNDADGPHAVERRRVAYLRHHRELIQQRQRLETERRVEELEVDAASMRVRWDEVVATKRAGEQSAAGAGVLAKLKLNAAKTHQLPGIYAHFDELGTDALRLLAERQQATDSWAQLNTSGKYHARYMKDVYPIAGAQLKLERERDMTLAAKKKLLLQDSTSLLDTKAYASKRNSGDFLSADLQGVRADRSKLDFYEGKLANALQVQQEQVRQAEADRQIRLAQVQYQAGLEQFWRLLHAGSKREVITWLKFHSFPDVNVPVRLVPKLGTDDVAVHEDRNLGLTPLMAACRCLSVDLVRDLLEHGAAVGLTTANGDTAMHFLWRHWASGSTESMKDVAALALRSQHLHDILVALLVQGADANAQNAFGETALQFCARYGLQDCAKLLLTYKGDAFARDRSGKSAVQYAHDNHHERLSQLLLNYDAFERTRAREKERQQTVMLLNQKRGALTATWSQTPENFFAKTKMEQQRAGHLRSQYVDSKGEVLLCPDEEQ